MKLFKAIGDILSVIRSLIIELIDQRHPHRIEFHHQLHQDGNTLIALVCAVPRPNGSKVRSKFFTTDGNLAACRTLFMNTLQFNTTYKLVLKANQIK